MDSGPQTSSFDRLVRIGFLVLVALIPIVRPLSFHVGGLRVGLSDVLFPFVFLLWLAGKIARREKPVVGVFHLLLGLYAATLSLSAVFSSEPERSFLKLIGEFYLFLLAIIAYDLIRDLTFVKKFTAAWLAGTVVTVAAAVIGLGLFYSGYTTPADNYFLSHAGSLPSGYPRIHSLFANANMMCNFLNVSLMFSLLAGHLGWIRKPFAWLLTGSIWFAAIFTLSTGLGGMLLSSGIWFSVIQAAKGNRLRSLAVRMAGVIAAVLIFAAACVSPDTSNTDRQISIAGTVIEPSVRVLVWESTLGSFAEHPLVGKGTGIDPARVSYTTLSGQVQILSDAHNMYLSVLGQAGLFGFAAFILLIGFLVRKFIFDLQTERRTILTALSCALIGGLLYQGLTGSFEDARHLWILIGAFACISRYRDDSDPVGEVAAV